MKSISGRDSHIDTRDVLQRIDELVDGNTDQEGSGEVWPMSGWAEGDWEEWESLSVLIAEVRSNADESPENGVSLIREDYFVAHVQEEYGECGSEYYESPSDAGFGRTYRRVPWDVLMDRTPFKHIDWEAVADEDRSDYQEVSFDGHTYLYR